MTDNLGHLDPAPANLATVALGNSEVAGPSLHGVEAQQLLRANPSGTVLFRDDDRRLVAWTGIGDPVGVLLRPRGVLAAGPVMVTFTNILVVPRNKLLIPSGVDRATVEDALGPRGINLIH